MTKTRTRPRCQIAQAVDNGPTVERASKPDFDTEQIGKKLNRVKRDLLHRLEKSGAIDSGAVTAANRWHGDYVFSQSGVLEINQEIPEDYVKGDVHTYAIARGKAGERVSLVRHVIGENAHRWLIFLLVRQFSLTSIGESMWPECCRQTQCKNAAKQAEIVLNMLSDIYRLAQEAQKTVKPENFSDGPAVFHKRVQFVLDERATNVA
ncbi:MAG: hypothetical protein ABF443_14200 [Acetobacter malorum]|uniref:hypothetical protein n=1 Tax=Acetobacter malorum TaxID=178901 RepID=UPI0039E894D8